ncbi:MAG: SPASM domain-containing protein, partial [Muribaculaceae bacterium]|nr:SPASM domain-containing protein [Muribaculaceae bacterium]
NGTLLNKDRIAKLRELKVIQYQITIDGDKITHNSIKVLGHNSAFDVSLANISEIAKHTRCTLRFNYTKDNLKPDAIIEDVKSRIPNEVRHNITFLIYKVWQENSESIDLNEVNRLVELSRNENILPQLPGIGMCYADNKYFDCVFSNGKIGKCDNSNPNSKHVCGEIGEDGEIIWDGENFSLPGIFDETLNADDCLKCRYFPVCWGPCPMKREKMMDRYGKVLCQFVDKEKEMTEFLLNIYKNSILRKNTLSSGN